MEVSISFRKDLVHFEFISSSDHEIISCKAGWALGERDVWKQMQGSRVPTRWEDKMERYCSLAVIFPSSLPTSLTHCSLAFEDGREDGREDAKMTVAGGEREAGAYVHVVSLLY